MKTRMRYESHELPDDGDLVPLLRQIASQPFVGPRGDVGDFSPFDWLGRLYNAYPEWRDRIDDAFATLLTAAAPLPYRVLEQIAKLPVRSFLPRLYETIAGRCAELAARPDPERTDGRSLLGSIVRTAAMMAKAAYPSKGLAHELAAIDRPEDGWPDSFRLALPGDIDALLPRLIGFLQGLDDGRLATFATEMVADGPPWTDVVLEEIGRGPPELRDRVAHAIRRFMDEQESSRSALATMEFPDDPELQARVRAAAAKPNPWPEYAARLGIDPAS
jgi:hypothetical protein